MSTRFNQQLSFFISVRKFNNKMPGSSHHSDTKIRNLRSLVMFYSIPHAISSSPAYRYTRRRRVSFRFYDWTSLSSVADECKTDATPPRGLSDPGAIRRPGWSNCIMLTRLRRWGANSAILPLPLFWLFFCAVGTFCGEFIFLRMRGARYR